MPEKNTFFNFVPITQTNEWADFESSNGFKATLLHGEGWRCLLIMRSTQLGNYWLAPYGPVATSNNSLQEALTQIHIEAKKHNISWVRLEPFGKDLIVKNKGLFKTPKDYNPADTSIIDLSLSTDKLRANLSSTYRNIIKKAKKNGVTCLLSTNPADIEKFITLSDTLQDTRKLKLHSADYYRSMAGCLMPNNMVIALAQYEGKTIAAAVVLTTNMVAYYAYAASDPQARKLEAGTALVWHIATHMQQRGIKFFDLFGVAPKNAATTHPWAGFSAFKRKFGGNDINYFGTMDMPISATRYWVYRLLFAIKYRH